MSRMIHIRGLSFLFPGDYEKGEDKYFLCFCSPGGRGIPRVGLSFEPVEGSSKKICPPDIHSISGETGFIQIYLEYLMKFNKYKSGVHLFTK